MTNDNKLLWQTILNEIETQISKANFLTLFKKTQLVSVESNVVTISAPSTMIISLLEKRFYEIIKRSVEKNIAKDAKIIFAPGVISENSSYDNTPLFKENYKAATIGHLPKVRKDYTFETFAVSNGNQLAYVSAKTVSKKVGTAYNPLFIYGPVGVGKTHLMQAIANQVYINTPEKKAVYMTSEDFTNEVVEAIRSGDTARMKRKFRSADLLVIDDIQFVAGKDRVQEELFHTFNTLIDRGAQIVFSSDRPPSEIKKIEKRLSSRFSGGLTVDIEPPDFELRCAILLIKAKKYNFDLEMDVAKKIAEGIFDTRSLEGNLLRLMTEVEKTDLSADMVADRILKNSSSRNINRFHPDEIIKTLCDYYGLKPTQIKSGRREASLVKARQVAMYILRNELSLSFVEIGNLLGGRDHSTIIHGVEKIESMLPERNLSSEINRIKELTKSTSIS